MPTTGFPLRDLFPILNGGVKDIAWATPWFKTLKVMMSQREGCTPFLFGREIVLTGKVVANVSSMRKGEGPKVDIVGFGPL